MQQPSSVIPDKLFFKIGEVCDLVGVQAHVLRYWETEFPSLQPQKNRSGQRTYRRKDVEMALRIRQLLYDEGFTIAGAKKKLVSEGRPGATRLKIVPPGATAGDLFEHDIVSHEQSQTPNQGATQISRLSREKIQHLRTIAEELLTTLNRDVTK